MKDYDIYLFDFDGTIVDSFDSMVYIFLNALERCGLKGEKDEVLQYSRQPISKTFFDKGGKKEGLQEFFDTTIGLLNEEVNLGMNKLFSDTLSSINKLKKKGSKVGIVTSNSKEHVIDILSHLDVDSNIFDVIVGFEATDKHTMVNNCETRFDNSSFLSLIFATSRTPYVGTPNRATSE